MELLALIVFWLLLIVHICLGLGVYADAKYLNAPESSLFAWPIVWCFATFLSGIVGLGVYWLLHHSMLNPQVSQAVLSQSISRDTVQSK